MIDLVSDALLFAGAICACVYCMVLSRRLKKLSGFESGLGGAIAVLSTQVDDMQKVLKSTEETAVKATEQLQLLIKEADDAAGNLEVLLASMDDLPEAPPQSAPLVLTEATKVLEPAVSAEPEVVSFVTARSRRSAEG
jgi:hypothetical protein